MRSGQSGTFRMLGSRVRNSSHILVDRLDAPPKREVATGMEGGIHIYRHVFSTLGAQGTLGPVLVILFSAGTSRFGAGPDVIVEDGRGHARRETAGQA